MYNTIAFQFSAKHLNVDPHSHLRTPGKQF